MKEKEQMKNKTGYIMLLIVLGLYGILYFVHADKTVQALEATFGVFKTVAPILLVVFFLMAFLNTFIDEKSVAKHLGDDSGFKGWFIALFGGVLSHGPGYIWYPMLQELRKKGALDGLIVAFLYARSIKLPWLPLMISYFGLTFTVVLTFYVLVGAFVQGVFAGKIMNEAKKDR